MVAQPTHYARAAERQEAQSSIPDPEHGTSLKWASVLVREVVEKYHRLEASVYSNDGRQARKDLEKCKWDIVHLGDKFIEKAFYIGRFKRIYVKKRDGVPFILPSQITEVYPKASKFISLTTNVDIESTRAKKGQVLLTRSGTIGTVSYVSKSLENLSISDDVIRIETRPYSGYIYAYLRSKIGRLLIETNNYGAVISHLEPEHLNHIPIPNPPPILKQAIHDLIEESFRLRDESNELMDETQALLKEALQLPDVEELRTEQADQKTGMLHYSVSLSELDNRLDASYHVPIVQAIERHLEKTAKEVVKIGDSRISQSVILPGRFKRVYVEEGSGIVFFSGKNISEIDPSDKKYLSFSQHDEKIKNELTIKYGMILVTCSGTIGKITFVSKHWDGWAMTHDIIRLVPINSGIAGYLYAWLSSPYARELIDRFTYGAVVGHIEKEHILRVSVPLLCDESIQRQINNRVLEANEKRAKAYALEQEALTVLSEQVIYAQ